ncbi:hypothetical protein [Sphingomonas sp. ABOLG]|jgi:hypothetical protein|uniref:hypothetical protein n=1 Tax=Sphingomonas sp. ABOLG TaxID=1985880 RepID=UPI000F7EA3CB|nr:hypothetical protein [Sphingomonas sp. ABOLG]
MSISFMTLVSTAAVAPPVAINVRHLAAFRAFARDRGETFGDEGDAFLSYNFEARVCPWSLASITALFDHDVGVISVVEEAQFRGLNIRFWRDDAQGLVMMGVATTLDGSASVDLSNDNAYALLDALGIERDTTGAIAVSELRSIVADPAIRARVNRGGLGHYADQLERLTSVDRTEDEVHVVWG